MNTSNNNLWDWITGKINDAWNWILEHMKIVLPVLVGLCIVVTIIIAVCAYNNKEVEEVAETAPVEESVDTLAVPLVALEQDAYPAINELMGTYYKALADGDTETVKRIVSKITDSELIRISEMSKYIDSYPTLDVYTKVGLAENTFLVYVCSEVKFYDYDKQVPGMKIYFVCPDSDGNYYIANNEDGTESELNYINQVNLQDDVVDLNNKVTVAYNDMLAENEDLSTFLLNLESEIDKNVGEALALAEAPEGEEPAEDETEDVPVETKVTVVKTVKTTDVVNIRSSDSETADKLGKAQKGEEFDLVEEKGNGWSKIMYNGKEAYIKSEYLEHGQTEEVIQTADSTADTQVAATDDTKEDESDNQDADTSKDSGKTEVTGKVKVKENVKIRKEASTDSEKIATAYAGTKLDMIEELSNGWTKIKYDGQIAYVKSEYVEKVD